MRTYRWILAAGAAVFLLGWLGGMLLAGPDGQPPEALRLVRAVGQLLVVVGVAGLIAVYFVRRLLTRRTRSDEDGGRD